MVPATAQADTAASAGTGYWPVHSPAGAVGTAFMVTVLTASAVQVVSVVLLTVNV